MTDKKLVLWTRAIAPYLLCLALCVVAAHAQDSITNLSHNSRNTAQWFAEKSAYIVVIVGLVAAWMRRSLGIALGAIMIGGALAISSAVHAWAINNQ